MALTPSTMLQLGTQAPDFALPDPSGALHQLSDFADAGALVVMFICNHCPFVVHLKPALVDFARDAQAKGAAVVAISSNDVANYPADSPAKMAEDIAEFGYSFPYLYDESQQVAHAYEAACTPDFFLFDGEQRLAYRGRFDASRPGNGLPITGADLRAALDAVLGGGPAAEEQLPSIGCNIKWKVGNGPGPFG